MFSFMEQGSLFPDPRRSATDDEIVEVLRQALLRSGRLSRMADLALNGVCAEHLVEQLRIADLEVVWRTSVRYRE